MNDRIDLDDIRFNGYLQGDGDFRSDEVRALRDEADVIITNPPFSLFREFLAWILEADKKFIIIGNKNVITCKEVFPRIRDNDLWLGTTNPREFMIPSDGESRGNVRIDDEENRIAFFGNICWFTNVDHGMRHEPLRLDTMEHNLKFNRKLRRKLEKDYGRIEYPRYDNYDAMEIPYVECIPSDYDGIMGVPITFMDKYDPDQFTIIGLDRYTVPKRFLVGGRVAINGKPLYARILITTKTSDHVTETMIHSPGSESAKGSSSGREKWHQPRETDRTTGCLF